MFAPRGSTSGSVVSATTTTASILPINANSSLPTSGASNCTSTNNTLSNEEQVGNSLLGTLCAPTYDRWLGDSISPPWGNCTVATCDATVKTDIPDTGVTRYYNFTVSRGKISADGVLRDVILVNNQFPGPLIEANWGDWIQVTVYNNISNPYEGTSLHWHGQIQRSTPWSDGVPSAAQCPIAPGASFTYSYQAEEHGSGWYHAHYSAQFSAGVAGPMIVHGPTSADYDVDLGPVMLSDWYHIPYFALVADALGTNIQEAPESDSVLINGRGRFDCSATSFDKGNTELSSSVSSNTPWQCVDNAPYSQFRFQSGKTHLLRLVNHGANGVQKFSVDHHSLTIIAIDYVPVEPYTVEVATLGVGQRADVVITALDTPTAAVWMRTSAIYQLVCGGVGNDNNVETLAAIYYEDADTTVDPTSVSNITLSDRSCYRDDPLTITSPSYAITPSTSTFTQDLSLNLQANASGIFEFMINDQAWHADYNVPLYPQAAARNLTFDSAWNVYNFAGNKSVILNVTNNMPLIHPFHLHGHNFYVLDLGGPSNFSANPGVGGFADGMTWNGTVTNPSNPMRRDGIIIPPYGYLAIQFELNNPGVWPFHCHIAWHLSAGQGLNIVYATEDVPALPDGYIADSCDAWDAYSSSTVVDQIDAGA
ncbi:multicopper oxidase [Teratosphaeria nubilosa]|uniref:Multicopper oxidase n=1 Tax=Teratosphaeria nubilosa TaxID=161662 RepID=A0A6G1KYU6_9PEZI|nr:multicopper oxidase [Teratosphaeria nubilosa]